MYNNYNPDKRITFSFCGTVNRTVSNSMWTKNNLTFYFNEKFAKQKGYPSIVAPPTFLTTVGYEKDNPYDFLDELGIEIDRVLSAGQNYIFYNLIFAGDLISMKSRISDIYDKKSGKLQFVEISSEFYNQKATKVAKSISTLVYR